MEERNAAAFLLGGLPTELIDHTDPGLRRGDFERTLRGYLREQEFPHQVSSRLVGKLFKMTCFFLRRKKALPRMQAMVNSHDWRERASMLKRFGTVEIARLVEKVLRERRTSQSRGCGVLSKELRIWMVRQLRTLEDALLFLDEVQTAEALEVRHLSHPPIDSQFMWELREYLEGEIRRASIEEIALVVAGCAVAAGVFSPKEVREDVASRIPMRISRARKRFDKQFEKSRAVTTLTYSPEPPLPIVLPKTITLYRRTSSSHKQPA